MVEVGLGYYIIFIFISFLGKLKVIYLESDRIEIYVIR